jgi:hypothetical protein
MTWTDHAACKSMPLDLFFPGPGERPTDAIAVCRACPVATDCLEAAETEEASMLLVDLRGIRGGLTAPERARRRRSRNPGAMPLRAIQHGTEAGAAQHRRRGEPACADCKTAVAVAKVDRRRRGLVA